MNTENTLEALYLKYRNKVSRRLEDESYFQYLFQLIKNGENVLRQKNHIIHKTMDDAWLAHIEEALPHLEAIISSRQHGLLLAEPEGMVMLSPKAPVTIVDRAAMSALVPYENRFIHTLLLRLSAFVNQHTDTLFWYGGDERISTLELDSHVEDDYEEIEYKLEINIKNKQSYLETDTVNMEIFKRIDRVRSTIKQLCISPFAQRLEGAIPLELPVQPTPLMQENVHYQACYALWEFLERREEVSYTTEVQEVALEYDEEYLYQIYSNLLFNYTVFKSILDRDARRIEGAAPKTNTLKPRFIKQIVEEFLQDYDIDNPEIRRLMVEGIIKAQTEEELRRSLEERAAKRKARAKEQERIVQEKARAKERTTKEKEKERELLAQEEERQAARLAKEAAKAESKEKEKQARAEGRAQERLEKEAAKAREKESLQREKAKEKERLAKQKAKECERLKKLAAKTREKERLQREKVKQKERLLKAGGKARFALEVAKAKEKERLIKEKAKEKERLAKANAKEQEILLVAAAKAREKERLAKEKAKEKERLAKTKAKEKERLLKAAAKAKEKERVAKEKARITQPKPLKPQQAAKITQPNKEKNIAVHKDAINEKQAI